MIIIITIIITMIIITMIIITIIMTTTIFLTTIIMIIIITIIIIIMIMIIISCPFPQRCPQHTHKRAKGRCRESEVTDGVAATAADDHCLDGAAHHDGTSFAHSRLPAARGNTSFISIGVVVSNSSRVGMSTMSG